jgi:hypothetical protein
MQLQSAQKLFRSRDYPYLGLFVWQPPEVTNHTLEKRGAKDSAREFIVATGMLELIQDNIFQIMTSRRRPSFMCLITLCAVKIS